MPSKRISRHMKANDTTGLKKILRFWIGQDVVDAKEIAESTGLTLAGLRRVAREFPQMVEYISGIAPEKATNVANPSGRIDPKLVPTKKCWKYLYTHGQNKIENK